MPVENGGKDVQDKPSGEAGGPPPKPANPNPKCNESGTEKLEKEIEKGEWWLIRIGVATLLINTVIALIYWGQLNQMRIATTEATKATHSAVWSAYWSCLSSQTAQNVFAQSQTSADDSHAMAAAAIEQAAAEMQSERANLVYLPRLPEQGDIMGPKFGIYETFQNIGRGDARGMAMKYWAVLVRANEHLRFTERKQDQLDVAIGYFPAGHIFPEKAEPPHGQLAISVSLRNLDGHIVATGSADAQDLVSGKTTAYVFGDMTYSDIAGTHTERFCRSVWVMQGNTMREGATTDNESRCNQYNRGDTEYSYRPLAQPQTSKNTIASNIVCVKPTD
jgi:hypothetical protein